MAKQPDAPLRWQLRVARPPGARLTRHCGRDEIDDQRGFRVAQHEILADDPVFERLRQRRQYFEQRRRHRRERGGGREAQMQDRGGGRWSFIVDVRQHRPEIRVADRRFDAAARLSSVEVEFGMGPEIFSATSDCLSAM
jgi:hypothetical protein